LPVKFTRLRVLGFKSFVEPTEFLIEPGLTGVVGPNGCGKSNLVEALRWVMGESSYKNMRASGMDDVIFSGSLNRPARNMAEVTLFVDNASRTAPAAFNDSEALEVSRRIEREAGSTYRVNGRDVRARDVQLLFADASTGAHSPAMVGQGRIGELIAAKPTQRRALLEEAAGISGLHNRRHEAELRLKAAEQNLARVDDVIAEIETHLDLLKRQARQAVRYRNLSGEIRKAEATVLHLRWLAASAALAEAEAAGQELARLADARAVEQAKAGRDQAAAAGALPDLRDNAARAGAALQRIMVARDALDSEEARVRERLAELERRLAQFAEDIAREQRMVADNGAILARLDDEERGLERANAAMAERQASAASHRKSAEAALAESEHDLSLLTAEFADVTARRSQHERAIREAEERALRQRGQIADVERELGELEATASLAPKSVHKQMEVEAAEAALKSAMEQAAEAERRSAEARERANATREPLSQSERLLGRLEAEAATLAALLGGALDGREAIVDSVKVASGYEAALGAAFGDDLAAPADTAAPAHWRGAEIAGDDPALPAGAEPLSTHVKAPEVLARRLAQIGIVARSEGRRLQALLKPGQRLVSRDGDLWRWDGYTAAAEAPSAAAQRLANRNRLAELEDESAMGRRIVADRREDAESAAAATREAEEVERQAREAWRAAQRLLDAARDGLASAEREAARIGTRRSALEEARSRLAAGLSEAEAVTTGTRAELAGTPAPESFAERLATLRQKVSEDRSAVAEARATVETLAREAELRSGRLAAIAVERQNWRERAANAQAQIVTLTSRRGDAEAEKARLSDEPAKIEVKRRSLLSEIAAAETARSEANDRLAAGEAVLAEADKAARQALDLLAEAREQRGRAEERVVAARQRLAEVADRINEALNCEPEAVLQMAQLKPGAPLPDLADTEARLERYRQERERLGAVNLRAEAEAAEVAERRDTLTKERDDLVGAIQRLRQGIQNLNREGRERLLSAFDTVNGHFRNLFVTLFGGGEAQLQLTESDDPLEAGLEIIAKPPGKKPQSMTLLSGGEQALTALALIFAVFLTNPAPICVLDEVDAPLDDANVERFCNLLDAMTRQTDTRFVTITHNPITMARMNRLFGVTMAERGVSQLVSVDLETAERFREAG
jgi:chromosome segregation protein